MLSVSVPQTFAAAARTFVYTLSSSQKSSGGVFDSSGNLVKTLWSGKTYAAGDHLIEWDGNFENRGGVVASTPEGTYTLKLVTNNVQYTWDGGIGNTSSSMLGENVWKSLTWPSDMAFNSSGVGVATLMYAEGPATVKRFATADPQSPVDVAGMNDANLWWNLAAMDGSHFYFAVSSSGLDRNNSSFVLAYNISDNQPFAFSGGSSITVEHNAVVFPGVIDKAQSITSPPVYNPAFVAQTEATGLAVQQSGAVLAVSHGGLGVVKFFNKTTGVYLNQITLTQPGRIAFAANGDLWVISGTSLQRFAAATLGSTNVPDTSITGLVAPLSVAVDPNDNNQVLVMDGGTSQQVKCYSYSSGWSVAWSLGAAGGYNATNGPDVSTNKFWFTANLPVLAYQSDSSFWVGDGGNQRMLHYSNTHAYLGQIAYLPGLYRVCADINDPTRVFIGHNGMLEYRIDYSQPLTGGDPGATGAWKLVKNWCAGLNTDTYVNGFDTVATIGGHTYGQVVRNDGSFEVVELPPGGIMRSISTAYNRENLTATGELHSNTSTSTSASFYKRVGYGFSSGNPTWDSAKTLIATAPASQKNDPSPQTACQGHRHAITSTGLVISLNASGQDTTMPGSYHLGAIPVGGTDWKWRASPGSSSLTTADTGPNGTGAFSTVGYGGLLGLCVFADGRDVFYGFNGQYAPYSNQYMHFHDNGLFIGQFGVSGDSSMPGTAGNILATAMVRVGTKLYYYTSDENTHGAAQRWSISGLDTITELTGSVTARPADPRFTAATPLPVSSTIVQLSWSDLSSTETGFVIERATNSTFTAGLVTVATTAANVTNYTDTVGNTGIQYYYRIKAINASGSSGYAYVQNTLWDGSNFLQQGRNGYTGTDDTLLSSYYSIPTLATNLSFGAKTELGVYERPGGEYNRSLIRFDLTPVANTGTIIGAQLVLTKSSQSPNGTAYYNENIALYRVADANKTWIPGTGSLTQQNGAAVWNQKADPSTAWAGSAGLGIATTDYVSTALATSTTGTVVDVPVTWTFADVSFLNDWAVNPANNAGFLLREITPVNLGNNRFYSANHPTLNYRPKLVLNIQSYAPVFSPAAGSYATPQTVTITSASPGSTIRYTTNGTTPTPTVGTVYTGPVTFDASMTLKAIAYQTGQTASTVTSGAYVITQVTLQQGVNSYTGAGDTYLSNYYLPPHTANNLSTGGRTTLCVYERSAGGGENARSLIRFDLSGITGTITGAQLVLTKAAQSPNGAAYYNETIALYRVADANKTWIPGTANLAQQNNAAVWNMKADPSTAWAGSAGLSTATTDYVPTPLATATTGTTLNVPIIWTFVDVSFLNDWKTNPGNNAGFLLREITPLINGCDSFHSSDAATAVYRPKLILTIIP